jgi:uncharacterized protein (TIGR01777 family)
MRVAITGASGLIGTRLVAALTANGDEAIGLPRSGYRLDGFDAVVNLAGEPVAQRWTPAVKQRIRDSRVGGTHRLVDALRTADPRPQTLVSSSAAGYYGDRGDEVIDESAPAGSDFLAGVCADWELEALAAEKELGTRVVCLRTGVVLDGGGGALKTMLPPFKLGIGGPVAGGRQYMPWIALDDVAGIYVAALHDEAWSGPVNASAPNPVTNGEFSKSLGRVLGRPAVMPVPAFVLRARYGEMATVVTDSIRMVPARALELGHRFRYPELDPALRAALGV